MKRSDCFTIFYSNPALLLQQFTQFWIDTDPSCGNSFIRDVDDCLALLQALNSPELNIVGIGTVFGNASHTTTSSTARHIVREFGCAQQQAICPYLIYSGAQNLDVEFRMTQATQALANLLQEQRVTILALGPLTNVATLLVHHPELRDRIAQVVAVAGRRPRQTFTPNTARFITLADRNFEEDPVSFDIVLRSGIPLTLTPYEVASKVTMSQYDLAQLSTGPPASRWLSQQAQRWFQSWHWVLGTEGVFPFDALAVGYLTGAQQFQCDVLPARIATARNWLFTTYRTL